jgi:hypothetical protein
VLFVPFVQIVLFAFATVQTASTGHVLFGPIMHLVVFVVVLRINAPALVERSLKRQIASRSEGTAKPSPAMSSMTEVVEGAPRTPMSFTCAL